MTLQEEVEQRSREGRILFNAYMQGFWDGIVAARTETIPEPVVVIEVEVEIIT